MPTTHTAGGARTARDHRARRRIGVGSLVLGLALAAVLALVLTDREPTSAGDERLPNPMGGPTASAPGSAEGSASIAGLEIDDVRVAMGDVPLGVTVVPTWELSNPTSEPVTITAGQPRVLEGCCPGPVYADEDEVAPGAPIEVPAGDSVRLAFPLQMHPGMDGPHHLTVPLAGLAGDRAQLEVTGDFTADASI